MLVLAFALLVAVVTTAVVAIDDKVTAIATMLTAVAVFVATVSYVTNPDWDALQADVREIREAVAAAAERSKPELVAAEPRRPTARLLIGIGLILAVLFRRRN